MFQLEQAPTDEPIHWLAYYIISDDPLGKSYMKALTQADAGRAGQIKALIIKEKARDKRPR